MIPYLGLKAQFFRDAQLSSFVDNWKKLTSDSYILCTSEDEIIVFFSQPIQQSYPPNSICKDKVAFGDAQICSLKAKSSIPPNDHELGEFISPIFSVVEKDGNVNLILNLKK